MATTTIVIGLLLIALGLGGYFGTGMVSPTALIPAAFGVVMSISGAMARDAAKRKLAMHIAVAVALVGYLACVPGLFKLALLFAGQTVARPAAVISQSLMAMLTGAFVILAIRSFRKARTARPRA